MRAEQAVMKSNATNAMHLSDVIGKIQLACAEGLYEIEYVDDSKAGMAMNIAYKLSRLGYIAVVKDIDTIKIGW